MGAKLRITRTVMVKQTIDIDEYDGKTLNEIKQEEQDLPFPDKLAAFDEALSYAPEEAILYSIAFDILETPDVHVEPEVYKATEDADGVLR